MNYFLDTNVVVAILRGKPELVRERLRRALARGATIHISSVVQFELWYGVQHSSRPRENAEQVRAFLAGDVHVVPLDEEDAEAAGILRALLSQSGMPIGSYDLLIAAQALRRGGVLITANGGEFARVPGLIWKDWTAPRGS